MLKIISHVRKINRSYPSTIKVYIALATAAHFLFVCRFPFEKYLYCVWFCIWPLLSALSSGVLCVCHVLWAFFSDFFHLVTVWVRFYECRRRNDKFDCKSNKNNGKSQFDILWAFNWYREWHISCATVTSYWALWMFMFKHWIFITFQILKIAHQNRKLDIFIIQLFMMANGKYAVFICAQAICRAFFIDACSFLQAFSAT